VRLHSPASVVNRLAVLHLIPLIQQGVDHIVAMDEEVIATIILLDEPETFLIVEELDHAGLDAVWQACTTTRHGGGCFSCAKAAAPT